MTPGAAAAELRRRLQRPRVGRWDVVTRLRHFALVNYAVPAERLAPHLPTQDFEIEEFPIGGKPQALLSIVSFVDHDFRFPRIAPAMAWCFAQTNHRVYVRHRATGEKCVWFLGTTLDSTLVAIPRLLWSMPWHRARYSVDCRFNPDAGVYTHWDVAAESEWAPLRLVLEDTGRSVSAVAGFASRAQFLLTLTHPLTGYYRRLDGGVGRYRVWHPLMTGLTHAKVHRASCALYPRLGIMSPGETARPHSAMILPQITFQVALPPVRLDP